MKTKLFTLFVVLLATTNLWAEFQYGNLYYETLSSNTAKVVGYIGNPTSVSIPTLIQYNSKQYTVTSIGNNTFYGCSSLTSITIPNSVTSIEEEAFYNCSSLTSVTIPNSVTSIGESAFKGCSGLKSMVVESGNTVYDSRENCNAIIKTATNTLIAGCKNTTIPNSVTSIGEYAFSGCKSLISVTIPDGVTSIGRGAFSWCSSLTSVTIPNSVTSIGSDAFRSCSSLTSINIPNSVTSIGESAFSVCSSLTSITIPNSVTSIGKSAFYGCSSLTTVICKAILVPSTGESVFANVPISSALLYVPDESVDIYKYMDPWDDFGTILPISQLSTDVEDVQISSDKYTSVKKVIRNGQVVILHNDKSYNIMGQEVE